MKTIQGVKICETKQYEEKRSGLDEEKSAEYVVSDGSFVWCDTIAN